MHPVKFKIQRETKKNMHREPKKKKISHKSRLKYNTKIEEYPACTIAYEDTDFLQSDEARSVRLHLDYLKAEIEMMKQGIKHTIVVFGSTRIVQSNIALDRLKKIEKKLESEPHSPKLLEALKHAESMVRKSIYYDEARRFGQIAGKEGNGSRHPAVTIMTGGGPGIMEAANRGAVDADAKSIGLNIQLPFEQSPNPYITPELCFVFHYFAIRKLHFLNRSKAFVFFPGGFGTLDELFEVLTLIQTKKSKPMPVVLIDKIYWQKAINLDFLIEEGVISRTDTDIIIYADNAQDAWDAIVAWHAKNKTPLI